MLTGPKIADKMSPTRAHLLIKRTKWQRGQQLQRHATAGAQQSIFGHKSKTGLFLRVFVCLGSVCQFFFLSRLPHPLLDVYEEYTLITIMLIMCSSFRTKSTFFCVVSEARTALWLLQASLALSYESLAVMNFKQELPTRCQLSPHTFSAMERTGAFVMHVYMWSNSRHGSWEICCMWYDFWYRHPQLPGREMHSWLRGSHWQFWSTAQLLQLVFLLHT